MKKIVLTLLITFLLCGCHQETDKATIQYHDSKEEEKHILTLLSLETEPLIYDFSNYKAESIKCFAEIYYSDKDNVSLASVEQDLNGDDGKLCFQIDITNKITISAGTLRSTGSTKTDIPYLNEGYSSILYNRIGDIEITDDDMVLGLMLLYKDGDNISYSGTSLKGNLLDVLETVQVDDYEYIILLKSRFE